MASYSNHSPLAYHVFPLSAARGIWAASALRAKAHLGEDGRARRTTRAIDEALGFADFVHLYLPRAGARFEDLPILGAQLGAAGKPAVPHAAIVIDTRALADEDCTLCNWNVAVGRPGVPGVCKGGNWARGTNAARVAEVWAAFRATSPSLRRARGFWLGPKVPIVPGDRIAEHWPLMRGRKVSELRLRSPFAFPPGTVVHAFSNADARSLARLGPPAPNGRVEVTPLHGYPIDDDPLGPTRDVLDRYLAGEGPAPDIDFDGRRA